MDLQFEMEWGEPVGVGVEASSSAKRKDDSETTSAASQTDQSQNKTKQQELNELSSPPIPIPGKFSNSSASTQALSPKNQFIPPHEMVAHSALTQYRIEEFRKHHKPIFRPTRGATV
mmetsp:Transcript_17879/g.19907  ORF Transcript_17879/g.19907 Transcript_17879/m.19907 type:complete len:117 (+) Transcript_17879:112-462(+)|eukprot:CAMPEP_0168517260 /NCGR_PEP_ID=MMETSP0405-20121227/5925_1 /TAXON_ID=498012 /ORGANISM="Trichosphaerium sp, Strain Am-I-7 wt" /LENGTH=116 /DNA_ID=CAMNT_0008537195 /DNA_START=63 /DNA_END=413 /DNA_ORIENTATION=-